MLSLDKHGYCYSGFVIVSFLIVAEHASQNSRSWSLLKSLPSYSSNRLAFSQEIGSSRRFHGQFLFLFTPCGQHMSPSYRKGRDEGTMPHSLAIQSFFHIHDPYDALDHDI